ESAPPRHAVLLLNPHPQFGGNLNNNVIRHLARRLAEEGAVTLRFDYRGVGASTLALPPGQTAFSYFAEMERSRSYEALVPDAAAAFEHLEQNVLRGIPRIIAGYSFGAILAAMCAPQLQVHAI